MMTRGGEKADRLSCVLRARQASNPTQRRKPGAESPARRNGIGQGYVYQ